MGSEWNTLVISPQVERRKSLLQAFREFPVNMFSVASLHQAREMLSAIAFEIVITEQKLEDGTYRELLPFVQSKHKHTRFFVMLPRDAQQEYTDAIRLGATDAIPFPLRTLDLGRILDRAMRETPNEQRV
jgi:DNA-binding NtrC family response regulator